MCWDDHKWITDHALELMLDEEKRKHVKSGLARVKAVMGGSGASAVAAAEVLNMVNGADQG